MDTKQGKSGAGPKLAQAGILFGAALVVSLGVGMLLQGDEAQPPTTPRARAVRQPVKAAPTVPAEIAAPEQTAAPAIVVEESPAPVETAPVTWAEAESAYWAGDAALASELFGRYVQEHPDNAWGQYMLGLSRRKAADPEGAELAFRAALEIDPAHGKSLVNLARTLLDEDRATDALPFVVQAVENEPESVDAHRVHGRVLHTLGRTGDALEAYAAALALDPADAWSLNNAGLILIEGSRFDEAAGYLARACEADAGVAVFRNNLGVALERTGRFGEAREAFAAALGIDAGYDKARVSLARVEELADAAAPAGPEPLSPEDESLEVAGMPGPEDTSSDLAATADPQDAGVELAASPEEETVVP